jgi:hypothetical protein
MSKTLLRHILMKKIFLTFLLKPYLYTFSLYENPSFIIFSAETGYISTRSCYRNINFLRDRITNYGFHELLLYITRTHVVFRINPYQYNMDDPTTPTTLFVFCSPTLNDTLLLWFVCKDHSTQSLPFSCVFFNFDLDYIIGGN